MMLLEMLSVMLVVVVVVVLLIRLDRLALFLLCTVQVCAGIHTHGQQCSGSICLPESLSIPNEEKERGTGDALFLFLLLQLGNRQAEKESV